MEIFIKIVNDYIPFILLMFGIYFTMVVINSATSIIKNKKNNKKLQPCMSKKGNVVYIIATIIYILLWILSIYYYVVLLKAKLPTAQTLNAFNLLTIYTMLYSLFIQDYVHIERKKIFFGNRYFETRKMKQIKYDKNKIHFMYGHKPYTIYIRYADQEKLINHLSKEK